MSTPTYITYIPHIRYGIATGITTEDNFGTNPTAGGNQRNAITLNFQFAGKMKDSDGLTPFIVPDFASKEIELYGPGDILGIDPAGVIRTGPPAGVNVFEPNYLPYVEFYEEDFPWRYTPLKAATDGDQKKLRPWLSLVVLDDSEFEQVDLPNAPLSVIKLKQKPSLVFPNPQQIWAWAHVQVNKNYGASPTLESLKAAVKADKAANPDIALSRVLCPRRLKPNKQYHAFLIPTFELGRRAGLGFETTDISIQKSAWDLTDTDMQVSTIDNPSIRGYNQFYPVYYKWSFSTGNNDDFESLVNKIKPKYLGPETGHRPLEIQDPGHPSLYNNLPPTITDGTLTLEGILKPIINDNALDFDSQWELNESNDYLVALKDYLNQQESYLTSNPTDDPVVSAPLYGAKHIPATTVNTTTVNWFTRINLDPRYRAMAGLGAEVVRRYQEDYMAKAWNQVGDVIEKNKTLNTLALAQFAMRANYEKNIASLTDEEVVNLSSSLLSKMVSPALGSVTYTAAMAQSNLPANVTSAAFRRLIRPGSVTVKQLFAGTSGQFAANLIAQINSGTVQVSPPMHTPTGHASITAIPQSQFSASFVNSIASHNKFSLSQPGSFITASTGGANTSAANNFISIASGLHQHIGTLPTLPAPAPAFDITVAAQEIKEKINPAESVKAYTNKLFVRNRADGTTASFNDVKPVMAAPAIVAPMYKPLAEISTEYLMPGLKYITDNSVSLLLANQKMIEAYMLGVNYEINRELTWRGYPTDQRGTPFRHFWDFANGLQGGNFKALASNQGLMDIHPVHKWRTGPTQTGALSAVGANSSRTTPPSNQIVLTIRGELLRRYPNTAIYAAKAKWHPSGRNIVRPLLSTDISADMEDTNKIRKPIFTARVEPDVFLVGFDLTYTDAKGDSAFGTGTNAGWYFVMEERLTEPHFGADLTTSQLNPFNSSIERWNDLSWPNIGVSEGGHIEFANLNNQGVIVSNDSTGIPIDIKYEDKQIYWEKNSADMAYALHRDATRVMIHAADMLPNL